MNSLQANKLFFQYEGNEEYIINDFTYTFPTSGVVGLLGPNGIGKSTLMALLAGAFAPSSGEVVIQGKSTTSFASEEGNK